MKSTAQEQKAQKQLQSMIADSKKEAAKALAENSARPRNAKELEAFTNERKKTVLLKGGEDPHVKKTNQLVQQTLERNKLLLEKAKELQDQLQITDKQHKEVKQRSQLAREQVNNKELANSKAVPLQDSPLYINTVIKTQNPQEVKQVLDVIISNQGCQAPDEQAVLDDNLLYKDMDFGPEASYNPIYFSSDMDQKTATELEYSLKKVQWLRPTQIAPKPNLVGFTDLNISRATPDEVSEMSSQYKVHGHRIIQGKLENRWFLSALSMVAAEQKLFNQVICREEGFEEYRRYGIYVFRFHKNGQQYYVIIDDRIPCLCKDNGQSLPLFARCDNPNLFWVSLVEKAFAKLHGRYYALQGGTTEEALSDLLGPSSHPETLFIDPLQGTDKTSLFNSLRILSYNHCVLGCKLDFEMFSQMDEDRKNNFYRLALAKGLQPRFYYTILDVREIRTEGRERGEPGQVHRLVRIKNPWANSQEWNGPFNDGDASAWTQEVRQKFNSMNMLDGYTDNERYIHRWNVEDGIFVMKIEDFVEMFNTIVVTRDFPESSFGVKYEDEWSPSYGFPHPKNSQWLNNRQYIFTFENPMIKEIKVTAILTQNDPRLNSVLHPPYKDQRVQIGLIVLKMNKIEDRVKFYDATKKVLIKKPSSQRSITATFTLTQGKYCIIPLTKFTNDISKYQLRLFFHQCSSQQDVIFDNPRQLQVIQDMTNPGSQAETVTKKDQKDKVWNQNAQPNVKGPAIGAAPRFSLYRSENESVRAQIGNNKFVWQVMTPFELDAIVNPQQQNQGTSNSVSELKRKQELLGDLYLDQDEENGTHAFGSRLHDRDFDQMQAFEKNQILMGIDLDDQDETQKGRTRQQIQEQQQKHQYIQSQIQDELDMSYYYITHDGFKAILPQLEEQYLSNVKRLNLAGCALTDNSVTELISSLKALHNQSITLLDLSDNKLTDQAILSIIDFLSRNSSLKEVILQDVADISQPMMTRLNAALKKNQMGLPSVDLMFQTAKQVDQALNKHLKFV